MPSNLDLASAFLPPAADAAGAAARYEGQGHHPDTVLLDRKAYIEDRDNATTAVGETSTGHTIKITFCLAHPPAASHLCIYGPEIEETDYAEAPVVACSEKDLVIIHFSFKFGRPIGGYKPGLRECFIYRAGRVPSFNRIPYPGGGILMPQHILLPTSLGLVPCPSATGDGDGQFLLVSISLRGSILDYDVRIFSSKTQQWTTKRASVHKTVPNLRQADVPREFDKVITLGDGVLGWVDLHRGILVCNVLELDQHPVLRIILLPKPRVAEVHYDSPNEIRDVTCNNGLIKLVDLELLYRKVIVHSRMQMQNDLGTADIIYDSDLALHNDHEEHEAPKCCYVPDGWRLWSDYRDTSWEYWRVECVVHCEEISVHNPMHSVLLPELRCYSTGKLTLKYLTSAYPSLSIHGDDLVYLVSKADLDNENAWMLGVHLGKRTLQVLEPYSAPRALFFKLDFCPYPFSKYFNPTPACLQISSANYSENDPNNATVHGYESEPSSTERQHPRSSPERNISALNGALNYALNDRSSRASITQNNLQLQQNFNMWGAASYDESFSGYANGAYPCYRNYRYPHNESFSGFANGAYPCYHNYRHPHQM